MSQENPVLVEPDSFGRLTVPEAMLRAFAETLGLVTMPEAVYVARERDRTTIRWAPFVGAREFQLNVRKRLLLARYSPKRLYRAVITEDALVLHG